MAIDATHAITLDHGEGGAATARLIEHVFLKYFGAPKPLEDAAVVDAGQRIAITTDTFVVRPLFFPGGDIGKLAICGTVNDLAVMGAEPKYITVGFVLEQGFPLKTLEQIAESMAHAAKQVGARFVTGDTKVVGKGEADGVFVNTSGIGFVLPHVSLSSASCKPGDLVLVSGPIGDHGAAIVLARGEFQLKGDLQSDCAAIWDLAKTILKTAPSLHCMRDPTRGGLATAATEIAKNSNVSIFLDESAIPIDKRTQAACDLLGFDPLYMPCEGRLLAVVPENQAKQALIAMQQHAYGKQAAIIGEVSEGQGVFLKTSFSGTRPLMLREGAQLPRIC